MGEDHGYGWACAATRQQGPILLGRACWGLNLEGPWVKITDTGGRVRLRGSRVPSFLGRP
jgi:hypothetical protein